MDPQQIMSSQNNLEQKKNNIAIPDFKCYEEIVVKKLATGLRTDILLSYRTGQNFWNNLTHLLAMKFWQRYQEHRIENEQRFNK